MKNFPLKWPNFTCIIEYFHRFTDTVGVSGYHHQPHIEEEIRCEPGASGVTVRFDARHDVSETWSEEVQDQFERSLDMDTSDHYIGENWGEPSEQDIDNKCSNCEEVNPHKRGSDGAFDN